MLRRLRKNEKGQAMVEFALVLPILLMLVCGIIDFGWLYFNQLTLSNAAREGARYAAIHYTTVSNDWRDEAEDVMAEAASAINSPMVAVVKNPSPDVTATAVADVRILTGFTSIFLGDSLELLASCTMKIEF